MAEIKIDDIKPNNNRYRQESSKEREREKIAPVVKKDKIVSTKKPLGRRLWDIFVGKDPKDIKDYLIKDVLIPGLKDTAIDTLSMVLKGERISIGPRNSYERTSYSSIYRSKNSRKDREYDRKKRSEYESDEKVDYRNIVLDTEKDAKAIVDHMLDRIESTGTVSVAEFFDMLGLPSRFTDNDWGWDNVRDIGIKQVSNGWLIDVAEVIYLN